MPIPKGAFYRSPADELSELTATGNSDTSLFLFKHVVRLRQEDKREEMHRLLQPALCYGNVREKKAQWTWPCGRIGFSESPLLGNPEVFFIFSFMGRGAIVCLHTPT